MLGDARAPGDGAERDAPVLGESAHQDAVHVVEHAGFHPRDTGTVGRHVVAGLRAAGVRVRAFSRTPETGSGTAVRGDLADPESVRRAVDGADAVAVADAVRALLDAGHHGLRHAVTGPASPTMADQVRVIGEVTGRATRWQTVPAERAHADLVARGWPPEYAGIALRVQEQLSRGPAPVTTTVGDVTGRPARSYRAWVGDHADVFTPRPGSP